MGIYERHTELFRISATKLATMGKNYAKHLSLLV